MHGNTNTTTTATAAAAAVLYCYIVEVISDVQIYIVDQKWQSICD